MCKGQVTDAFSCKYDICLCKTCADRYSVTGVPQVHLSLHHEIQEAALKVEGEVSQEAVAKIQAAVPRINFKALILENRAELMVHLSKALEDMNNLEEVKLRALNTERQLEECRREVERLRQEREKYLVQGGGQQVQVESSQLVAKMEEMFERQETKQTKLKELEDQCARLTSQNEQVSYENKTLSERVASLTAQLQQTQRQLTDQQGLKAQLENLTQEVARLSSKDISTQVKESMSSLTEHLHEMVKTIAQKVADVLPLVAHIRVDELDVESVESLLDLACLGVQDQVEPKTVRKVARVCAQVAKLVGPCKSVASFVTRVNRLLRDSPEKAKALVGYLEFIYGKASGHKTASDMLRRFLNLQAQDTNTFDEAITLVLHFSEVLVLDQLCDFGIAITQYLEKTGNKSGEWTASLSSLPVKWNEDLRELGEASVRTLVAAVVQNQFNSPYLQLSQLLSSYRPLNPELLLSFSLRACDALLNKSLESELEALFSKMTSYIDSTANFAVEVSRPMIDKAFLAMKLLLPGAKVTKEQLVLLSCVLVAMPGKTNASAVLDSLLQALQKIQDSDAILLFGFAVLTWMFDGGRGERGDVQLAGQLLKCFVNSDPRTLLESAQQGAQLLTTIRNVTAPPVEASFGRLMDSGLELPRICTLLVTLVTEFCQSPVAAQIDDFIKNLFIVLDSALTDTRGEVADKFTALMQKKLCEAVLATSQCHAQLIARRCEPEDALRFTKVVLRRCATGDDNTDLYALLEEINKILRQENQAYTVVFKSCELCVRASFRLPQDTRSFGFNTFVLKQLQNGYPPANIESFLIEFIKTLAQDNVPYSVAFRLAHLYTKYVLNLSTASEFLRDNLIVVRALPPQEELEALLQDVEKMALTPKESMVFITAALQLCLLNPADTLNRTLTLKGLTRQAGTTQLLKTLALLRNSEDVSALLDVVCAKLTTEVMTAVTNLASVITTLANLGFQVAQPAQTLRNILHQEATGLGPFFASLKPVLDTRRESGSFVLQLLDTLPRFSHALIGFLAFVPQLLSDLIAAVGPEIAVTFCQTVLIECFTSNYTDLLKQLQLQPERLVKLYKQLQRPVTIEDVKVYFGFMLINVQTQTMRLFDCLQQTWGNNITLQSAIKVSEHSRCTFLDSDRVFCCGGQFYVGYAYESFSSGSTSYSATSGLKETYILNRSTGVVYPKLNMNVGRWHHGILFYEKTNVVYVFGGCKR